jgi:hypothetical protein
MQTIVSTLCLNLGERDAIVPRSDTRYGVDRTVYLPRPDKPPPIPSNSSAFEQIPGLRLDMDRSDLHQSRRSCRAMPTGGSDGEALFERQSNISLTWGDLASRFMGSVSTVVTTRSMLSQSSVPGKCPHREPWCVLSSFLTSQLRQSRRR